MINLNHLLRIDPYLEPYKEILARRQINIRKREAALTRGKMDLTAFAAGHEYFGLHFEDNEWIFREWAPNAHSLFLLGDMTDWLEKRRFALERIDARGVWEIRLPSGSMSHGDLYRLKVFWPGGEGDRIPAYTTRVDQDAETLIFNAQVWHPDVPYRWRNPDFRCPSDPPYIYEAHVGMAQEEEKIGSYQEFTRKIIPRIAEKGYNMIQLMAIQEHPYYASFGYQVSNFFAASSRFGPPEALKNLIDTAHEAGLGVIMDLVHSHGVSNEVEGLSRFDGTVYQYFHDGPRGTHSAWGSRCFDYGKPQVLHFLLSNCRFWLDEYRFDGFRFDGITSMLYLHHGLGKAFTAYDDYFDDSVDEDALTYLALANRLIHTIRPDAITIAEDVSGMPGLAAEIALGGIGFDYRFSMGVADYWTKLAKDVRDEDWPMGNLWHELTNRRRDEKIISYVESHDQALVGDQTLIFRLIGPLMYDHMRVRDENLVVDRGMALHKMIRLVTLATAGNGYLTFMGNEFGHPEWIDFPRQENNWSFGYARRQWRLAGDPSLKYHLLARFDRDMIAMAQTCRLLESADPALVVAHDDDKVLIIERAGLIFALNFHPHKSYTDYRFTAPAGKYRMILNSDAPEYGGHRRLTPGQQHVTRRQGTRNDHGHALSLYLPSRAGFVLNKIRKDPA